MQRRINHSRGNRIHTDTVFRIFDGEAASNRVKTALDNHWDRGIYACNRIIRQRGGDADDASTRFLRQHPFDIGKVLGEEYPALLTNASIARNVLMAVSATLAAVAASPISPSTKASFGDEGSSFDLVTLRE